MSLKLYKNAKARMNHWENICRTELVHLIGKEILIQRPPMVRPHRAIVLSAGSDSVRITDTETGACRWIGAYWIVSDGSGADPEAK